MSTQSMAEQIADAVAADPELAQELVSDPAVVVERITGETGADVTALLPATLEELANRGADLSFVDLSALDLSQIDVARLDVAELQDAASKLNVDLSKLDMAGIAGALLGQKGLGALGGLFGGLFGK